MAEFPSFLDANKKYVASFTKGDLAIFPAKHVAILVCMDARIDPAKAFGLQEGDAHVIRNAGGRASDDAIRSFVISHKLLGTNEWVVVHHTNCGMELFTNDVIRGLLKSSLETATIDANGWHDVGKGPGSTEGDFINFLTIDNLEQSVVDDIRRIRSHPLVPKTIPIRGFIYDVKTGQMNEVAEASKVGAATA